MAAEAGGDQIALAAVRDRQFRQFLLRCFLMASLRIRSLRVFAGRHASSSFHLAAVISVRFQLLYHLPVNFLRITLIFLESSEHPFLKLCEMSIAAVARLARSCYFI